MASINPTSLRCEHIDNPLQVHRARPRLSWRLQSPADAKDVKQTAYRVIAATSPELLAQGIPDLWDSNKVISDATLIAYEGKPLASRDRIFWKVAAWLNDEPTETWSEVATFEMGLLVPADWKAKWIESPDASCRSPLFRKRITLDAIPKIARAYLCGLGYSELYINGKKVGDSVLDPAQTDYESRCLYVAHNVAAHLKQGENEIQILLGNGFYTQDRVWGGMSYGRPKFILQMHLDDVTIVSDKTWLTTSSAIVENNVYAGETYEARKETPADQFWKVVEEVASPTKSLESQLMPPIRAKRTIEPVSTKQLKDVQIIDLGENFAGWCKLTLQNAPQKPIRIRTAETIHPDGSLDTASTGVFATNVEQIDTYIPKGAASESWEPRFTYHGFRYVEVSNATPSLKLQGVAVHTDMEPIGTFESSDETLNRIHATAIRTLLSNSHSIPTDCPAREKCGWLGDAHIAAEFVLCTYDAQHFYDKFLADIESTYHGNTPGDCAPGKRCTTPNGHLDWGLATILIPWHVYLYRGDEAILRDHYATMNRFFTNAMKEAKDNIVSRGYGDWCPPGSVEPVDTPPALSITALFAQAAGCISQIATRLGHKDDATKFAAQKSDLQKAFNQKFFDAKKQTYGSQCADALALEFNLADPANVKAIAQSLNADVMETHKAHHTTGIFGTRYLHAALARNGHGTSALALLRQTTYPSIGHLFSLGATTFWECWGEAELDKKWGARSLNHVMQTAFVAWFYNGLAGINPDPQNPGFKHILFQPQFLADEKLTQVKATHASPHGTITSQWQARGDAIHYHCEIPPNTTATLTLPNQPPQNIGSGSYDFNVKNS